MTTCCAPACSQALPVKPQGVWARGSEAWAGSRDLRNLEFVRWGSSGPSSLMLRHVDCDHFGANILVPRHTDMSATQLKSKSVSSSHYGDVTMGASVSNHQSHGCLLNRLFKRRSTKTSKLRVTGLWVGNSPGTGEFPAQMASNAENVSIWWRHLHI